MIPIGRASPLARLLNRSFLTGILLLGTGCAAPVSVRTLDLVAGYRHLNRSALSGNTLSDSTQITLRRYGLLSLWKTDPEAAIASLRESASHEENGWPDLFPLAELSYLRGRKENSKTELLAAAVYAYAYLSPGSSSERPSPYDERFRQACDIYNLSLAAALMPTDGTALAVRADRLALPFGTISVTLDPNDILWEGRTLGDFRPTPLLSVQGMQNIYRDPGLGVPLAALASPNPALTGGLKVAPLLRVPANMLLVMDDPRAQVFQSQLSGTLRIHNVFEEDDAQLGENAVPLEYDQTAARVLSLVEASGWKHEHSSFLNGTLLDGTTSQLVALEPHKQGRRPVVLIHGTASSPFRWADMVNDLLEDPAIRDHFEFWFFTYASGSPIPYSALQLRQAVEAAVTNLGGTAADAALGQITLIGHSQGGLLAKMLVIDPGDRLWNGLARQPLSSLQLSSRSRTLLQDSLFPRPLPAVTSVIFIATPQRGSYVAAFSVSRLIGRLVTLPLAVTDATKEIVTGNGGSLLMGQNGLRVGSIYGMSPNSPFIRSLAAVPVAPGVGVHSIIPVTTNGPLASADDGVVKYSSAHIPTADSELVVHSGHSTQSNQATIAEVRRILLQQLSNH